MAGTNQYGNGHMDRRGARLKEGRYTLEVISAIPAHDKYWLRLRVVEGDRAGYEFSDHCERDAHTGNIVIGTKAWRIFEACFQDTHRKIEFLHQKVASFGGDEHRELEGQRFVANVGIREATGDNYVKIYPISPIEYPDCNMARSQSTDLINCVMRTIAQLPSV